MLSIKSITLFAVALTCVSTAAFSDDARPPAKERFHVYLLIGQSNMAGRGKVTEADRKSHPRVLKLDKNNRWVPATAPLHFDKPRIAGTGLGDAFGRAMAEADASVTIGLIPSAFGGTPLRRWVMDGDLYKNAVKRAKLAMKVCTLKGVLWHQGESDSRSEKTAKSYGQRLSGMIAALRKDLGRPKLPVVVGELGRFLNEKRLPHFKTVNQALRGLPKAVPHTAFVESADLKAKRDGVHFDRKSLHIFGRRYAKALQKLQGAKSSSDKSR